MRFIPARSNAAILIALCSSAACSLSLGAHSSAASGDVVFVSESLVSGADDGTSWQNAYRGRTGLAKALAASGGTQIWVAAGTYAPGDAASPRSVSFGLASGLEIYGGFVGNESSLDQRDAAQHVTILSGDLKGDDAPGNAGTSDNCFHVVTATGVDASCVLDGFTIRAGRGSNSAPDVGGGGVLIGGSPSITRCIFIDNRSLAGGAVVVRSGTPAFRSVRFDSNLSSRDGGALACYNAGATLLDCEFVANTGTTGGGIYSSKSDLNLSRCMFIANICNSDPGEAVFLTGGHDRFVNCIFKAHADSPFGGLPFGTFACFSWNGPEESELINCTFEGNVRGSQALLIASGAGTKIDLHNSILWGNGAGGTMALSRVLLRQAGGVISPRFCTIQGWDGSIPGVSCDGLNPGFTDPLGADATLGTADDGLSPASGSPCIDAADNAALPAGEVTDALGLPRFRDDPLTPDSGAGISPIADRGALEFQPRCAGDLNGDDFVDDADFVEFADAYNTLDCLDIAMPAGCPSDLTADGVVDDSDFVLFAAAYDALVCP
ncbi:MAG: hypothetical protein KF805_15595 [Phycisphaeraceae bacterium]|nr:hypothetical protein [Phycisphaeraceae bacterium]